MLKQKEKFTKQKLNGLILLKVLRIVQILITNIKAMYYKGHVTKFILISRSNSYLHEKRYRFESLGN